MTLTQILQDLYRRLGYASSPDAGVTTRLTSFVNQTHRQILAKPGMERLRDDTITFASVASQPRYTLPPNVARIKTIHDRTSLRRLKSLSLDDLRAGDPGLTSGGTPDFWVSIGYQAVAEQPSAATALYVVSDSASDTTQAVKTETVVTGGYTTSASTTLTGTSRAQVGTLSTHIEVTKFYLDAAAVGNVSLYTASSGGTELARLGIGKTYGRWIGIQLWPTPSAVVTYHVDYTRVIADMSNGTDEPLLPEDFHYLLVDGTLIKEWTKKDDLSRRQAAQKDFDDGMKALRNWVLFPPDFDANAGQGAPEGSNLGGWFPAGRW